MRGIFLTLVVMATAAGAQAQTWPLPFEAEALRECVFQGETALAGADCIGTGANACFMALGGEPHQLQWCVSREHEFWEDELTTLLPLVNERLDYLRESEGSRGHQVYGLHGAWLAYRQEACPNAPMSKVPVEQANLEYSHCMMDLTGRHVLWLHDLLRSQ